MEEAQSKLFEAAAKGCVRSLQQLLIDDRLILDRVMANYYSETPLHVAAMLGHIDFVNKIMELKPQLANELNSQRSSPLHLASAKGHVGVVKALLSANNHHEMCLARDRNGLTPLHLAAIKGRNEVVKLLLRAQPEAARLVVYREETILHLCVKHYQLETLKLFLKTINEPEFVNSKDADGNTILHLAVADKQVETTILLLTGNASGLQVNALNLKGLTAMDVLIRSRRDMRDSGIEQSLKQAGGIGAPTSGSDEKKKSLENTLKVWLEKKKNALMVVASLIATMGFQIGVSPPGGVWQDDNYLYDSLGNTVDPDGNRIGYAVDSQNNTVRYPHKAGYAVLARNNREAYDAFYIYNTTGFICSLSIIFLLMSGLPVRNRFFMWILIVITWVAISATATTYNAAVSALTPEKSYLAEAIIAYSLYAWIGLTLLIFIAHIIRLFLKLVRKLWRGLVKLVAKLPWRRCTTACSAAPAV